MLSARDSRLTHAYDLVFVARADAVEDGHVVDDSAQLHQVHLVDLLARQRRRADRVQAEATRCNADGSAHVTRGRGGRQDQGPAALHVIFIGGHYVDSTGNKKDVI